ncbi:MAG TPA: hypothetical protein VHT00_22505 [Stellaceae bacterium]|nr:hypothetical protein [Stellaceae bacterium]
MVIDYDFRLGRSHLRGKGWRGLIALVMVLLLRAMIIAGIAISTRIGVHWLVQLLQHARSG